MIKVGIDAISFYTSRYYLELSALAKARQLEAGKFNIGLGQQRMAVFPHDEDIVTMAADAAHQLLKDCDPNDIEMLMFATESAIDQSKAAGIFVHQLLKLPSRCRVIELKQACYSATAGLQMAMSLLRQSPQKKILLIASDIARYGLNTSGESSQGGGAVAMLLSANPRLMMIEPESGFYTEDAMDFWRPNYREEAIVEGKYSCELYLRLLEKTWEQYNALSKRTLDEHAYVCYHVPFPRLVEKAHQVLSKLNGGNKLSDVELTRALSASLQYGRVVGNCYTAALYLALLSLLENTDRDLSHTRIGLYSYGSGSIAEFFSGVIQPDYQRMLNSAYHQTLLKERQELTFSEYEAFYQMKYPVDGSEYIVPNYKQGRYRLAAVRQHKRIYEILDQ